MEFTSKEELYQKLLPVFKVKQRIISITKYKKLNNSDIWKYLIVNKWTRASNLTIQEIVNDIITIEPEKVYRQMEENYEKK